MATKTTSRNASILNIQSTPSPRCIRMQIKAGNPLSAEQIVTFPQIAGSLLYLSRCSRPDIPNVVSVLGIFSAAPIEDQLKLVSNY